MTGIRTPSGKLKSGDGLELFWRGWVADAPAAVLIFVPGVVASPADVVTGERRPS